MVSGAFAVLSVFIRQTNVVWIGFFFLLDYIDRFGLTISMKSIIRHCRDDLLYVLCFFLFMVFVFVNHGVSLAGKDMQPIGVVSLGNILFLFFLLFFILLPLHIYNFRIIAGMGKKILLVAGIMLGYVVIGMITFSNTHPWNQYPIFIRNVILTGVAGQSTAKFVYFLLGSITLGSLCVTRLNSKHTKLFSIVAFLSLIPYWLVEPRYAFVPLGLFLIWRVQQNLRIERILLIWFIMLSLLSMWGLFQYTLYL